MTKRMLINALDSEECRVVVAEDDRVLEFEVERADQVQQKGNIYKAEITRIEPSLQAAFLDIGANRNGFLQINDINPTYFRNWPPGPDDEQAASRPAIQDVLEAGQPLIVQVVKDERAAKGATLTTNLSIPGKYLVLMVGNQRGGVSRKISDETQRSKLRQAVQKLRVPAGMGVIVRTAGINKSTSELQADLDGLIEIWHDIVEGNFRPEAPIALYTESDLAIRTIRDYLSSEIKEILIDEEETYQRALQFVTKIMPNFADRVKYFDKPQPLFTSFHLDAQVEEIDHPEVILPSGGSIVINVTEAVVTIDVNSGRSTGQADVEETAFDTNCEAAEVIARQLRLRDLGGLIVIDFIDMLDKRHKQVVEKTLKDAVRSDKAKIEVGRISRFGLLEMSRQRLKASLVSQSHSNCPHCRGRGRVKNPESTMLEVLRKIQSAVFAGGVDEIKVRMAPAAALLLLNNKRRVLTDYEEKSNTHILVYADGRLKPDEYELEVQTHKSNQEPQRISSHAPAAPRSERQSSSEDDRHSSSDSGENSGRRRGRSSRGGRGGRRRSDNRRWDRSSSRRGRRKHSSNSDRGERSSDSQRDSSERGSNSSPQQESRSSEKSSHSNEDGAEDKSKHSDFSEHSAFQGD